MKNQTKLVATILMLIIPILLFGSLFYSQSRKEIEFSEKELVGIDMVEGLIPLMISVMAEDNSGIVLAHSHSYGMILNRAPRLRLETAAKEFRTTYSDDPAKKYPVVAQIRSFLTEIGDSSNLVLDPSLNSYYLMDALVVQIPNLVIAIDDVVQARMRLEDLVARKLDSRAAVQVEEVGRAAGQLLALRAALEESIRKSFNASPSGADRVALEKSVESTLDLLRDLHDAILDSSRKLRDGSAMPSLATSEEIQQMWGQVYSRLRQTSILASTHLRSMIAERVAHLSNQLHTATTFSVLFAFAAIITAFNLFRSMLNKLDERVMFLAHHDELTGLRNRANFLSETETAIEDAKLEGKGLALHVIDLDHFKTINDTLGHPAGDAVLRKLAEILTASCRADDTVARFGGDEFVILQRNVKFDQSMSDFADRIVALVREPIMLEDRMLKATVSIGSAKLGVAGDDATALLQSADMALYAAKQQGRDRAVGFTDDLAAYQNEQNRIEHELRYALDHELLDVHFQPQYDVYGRILRGFEALARMTARDGRSISPGQFIPVAERLGLIAQLGRVVLKRSCEIALAWPEGMRVAVNISPEQFAAGSVEKDVRDALSASGLPAERLQIEITESSLLEDAESVIRELEAIRALGVTIAMDDFGTGYSALNYLWRFPIDKLKIDRSFVVALDRGEANARNILRTVVMLGQSLNMTVTAEGVETEAQAAVLAEFGCNEIQGYLYGRPMPAIDIAALILKNSMGEKQEAGERKVVSIKAKRKA